MMRENLLQQGTVCSIPSLPFAEGVQLQQSLVEKRSNGSIRDTLILTEHEPTLTLGKTTQPQHWETHWEELQRQGIGLHRTNRGGSVTFHAPGQIIGYPILQLRNFCPGPKIYVQKLEEVLIRTLQDWGIEGCRHEKFRGVWVRNREDRLQKIASIGVRITKGITMHGFALNVNVDLKPFALLSPCGIENCLMTSMQKILDQQVATEKVQGQLVNNFSSIFGIALTEQGINKQEC